jgi:membrane protein
MKNKIQDYISSHPLKQRLVQALKKIRFRGGKISLYFIIKVFFKRLLKDEILERSNAVAFSFTVAVFPAIIVVFTLIPYIHSYIPEVDANTIMHFLSEIIPPSVYQFIENTVTDIVSHSRGDLLTFGALLALFLATNGTMSLIAAFNSRYKSGHHRSYLKTRFVATNLTIMLAFVVIAAVVLLVVGQVALDYIISLAPLDISNDTIAVVLLLRFVVLFVVFLVAISSLYYFGSEVHHNWAFFSFGSIVATFLSLAASYGFSEYITSFGTYNKLYGSIGAMLAFMIWIMIISIILLTCFELNASIHYCIQLTKDKRNHPMLEAQ